MPRLVVAAWACGLTLSVSLALAQEVPPTSDTGAGQLVCDQASGACAWRASPAATRPDSANVQSDSVTLLSSEEGADPVRWLFAWAPSEPSPLTMRPAPAPQCADSIDEAMGRIQAGLETGNLNLLFSGYDWAGQSTEGAERLTDRLALLTPGSWQARVVEGRLGSDRLRNTPPERMRLLNASGQIQAEFSAVERMTCWFLRLETVGGRDSVSNQTSRFTHPDEDNDAGHNIVELLPANAQADEGVLQEVASPDDR